MKISNSSLLLFICIIFFVNVIKTQETPTVTDCSTLPYKTAGTVTITGTGFISTTTYSILFDTTIPCLNMNYESSEELTCDISLLNYLGSPFSNLSVTVQFNGGTTSSASPVFKFSKTIIKTAKQVFDKIVFTGSNFYLSADFYVAQLAGNNLSCSYEDQTLICSIEEATLDATLSLQDTNVELYYYYSNVFTVYPILLEVKPNSFLVAKSQSISIIGKFFQYPLEINQGDYVQTITQGSPGQSLIFYSPPTNGIQTGNKTITLSFQGEYSNSLLYSYKAPTLSSASHLSSPGDFTKVTVNGNNFGLNSSFISVTLGSVPQTIIPASLENDYLEFTLNATSAPGELFVKVDGQTSGSLNLNLIPNIISSSKPAIQRGSITVKGQWLIGTKIIQTIDTAQEEITSCQPQDDTTINNPVNYICLGVPNGLGLFSITAESNLLNNTKTSTSYSTGYESPVIANIKPKTFQLNQGNVTITIIGRNFQNTNLSVTVGDIDCEDSSVSFSTIICTFVPPTGNSEDYKDPFPVRVTVDGFIGENNSTLIVADPKPCPNECSKHGTCQISGICNCYPLYSGDDCSIFSEDSSDSEDSNDDSVSTSSHLIVFKYSILLVAVLLNIF